MTRQWRRSAKRSAGTRALRRGRALPTQRVREVRTGVDEDLVVRVFGQDLSILREKADELYAAISEIDGVVDPLVDLGVEEPTVEVEVDLEAAQQHGIKPATFVARRPRCCPAWQSSLFEERRSSTSSSGEHRRSGKA